MLKNRAGDLIEGGSDRSHRIIRRRSVEAKTGLGRSAIYQAISNGTFPRPVPLGAKAVGWLEDEIDAWIEARCAERNRTHQAARPIPSPRASHGTSSSAAMRSQTNEQPLK